MVCWLVIAQSTNIHLLCPMVSVGQAFTLGTMRTGYLHSTMYGASAEDLQILGAEIIVKLINSVSGACC